MAETPGDRPDLPGEPAADRRWLQQAIELSRRCPPSAAAFSVGAVIVSQSGAVIATGFSRERDPADHAEEVGPGQGHRGRVPGCRPGACGRDDLQLIGAVPQPRLQAAAVCGAYCCRRPAPGRAGLAGAARLRARRGRGLAARARRHGPGNPRARRAGPRRQRAPASAMTSGEPEAGALQLPEFAYAPVTGVSVLPGAVLVAAPSCWPRPRSRLQPWSWAQGTC